MPDGERGELVFTSLTKQAMPVVRYRTRDLTRLLPGTAYPAFRRMEKVTGRTDDMMIVRGVNVFPSQVEEQILAVEGLAPHYLCVLTRPGSLDELTVQVEAVERRRTTPGSAPAWRSGSSSGSGSRRGSRCWRRTRWSARWARRSGSATSGAQKTSGRSEAEPVNLGGPLLQERGHALLAVAERLPVHRQRVGQVRLERVGGGAVAVEQPLGQAERGGGAVDDERAGQLLGGRHQVVGLVHAAHQPAGEGLRRR